MRSLYHVSVMSATLVAMTLAPAAPATAAPWSRAAATTLELADSIGVGELHVDIVASSSTIGVGETIQLSAVTAPPLADTGGQLMWTVLEEGWAGLGDPTGETTSLELMRPSLARDYRAVVVGVVYHTATKAVSTATTIYLDDTRSTRPYVKDFQIEVEGQSGVAPLPGQTATLTMTHHLPPGYSVKSETVTTTPAVLTAPAGENTDLEVDADFVAEYAGPNGEVVTDSFSRLFLLPFSEDLDGNGNPDLVDADFLAFDQAYTAESCEHPDPADPVRAFRLAAARYLPDAFAAYDGVGLKAAGLPPECYNPNLTDAYGQITCDPTTWACKIEMGPLTRMPNDIDWLIITKIHELKHWFIYQIKHLGLLPCDLAEWWQDEVPDHNGDFVEKWAQLISLLLFGIVLDEKPLVPDPPIPDDILALDDNPFGVQPTVGATFNSAYDSENVIELQITNANPKWALENVTITPKLIESTVAGDFNHTEIAGGYINGGSNGIAETVARGDDLQLTAYGRGNPMAKAIWAGPDGVLDTAPAGDDTVRLDRKFITSGYDGILDTFAARGDKQLLRYGGSAEGTVVIEAGPNGKLDTRPAGDDAVTVPSSSPIVGAIEVLSTPASIGAGGSATATLSIAINPVGRPQAAHRGAKQPTRQSLAETAESAFVTFEVAGTLGGVPVAVEYPVQLYLPADDCDADGQADASEIAANPSLDGNGNGVLDACECDPSVVPTDPGFAVRNALF